MAEFYLSAAALNKLYYNPQTKRIVINQKCLYIDATKEELAKIRKPNNDEIEGSSIWQDVTNSNPSLEIVPAKSICDKVRNGTFTVDDVGASPVFIIEMESVTASKLQNDYGVICMADRNIDLSVLKSHCHKTLSTNTDRRDYGRKLNSKILSWKEILSQTNALCNAIVVNDHYLFRNEDKVAKGDKFLNITQIFDSLLPGRLKDGVFQILFLCKKDDFENFGHGSTAIKKHIKKLRSNYQIEIQIVTGDNNCKLFEYTHNRQIATNYAIISADHVLAAFKKDGTPYHDQNVNCHGLYGRGILEEDDDDIPEIEHELFLERVSNIVQYAINHEKSGYQYKENGNDKNANIMKCKFVNRLISQFFGLRDGDNCCYLSVPNRSDWQKLKIKPDGIYAKISYKDRIVVPSTDKGHLEDVKRQIVDVFKNSPSVEGESRNDNLQYYWVACSTDLDIKTIHVKSPDLGEIASNYYLFNCYQNKQDAEAVIDKVKTILKNNNLW